jgi:hypothetical protein
VHSFKVGNFCLHYHISLIGSMVTGLCDVPEDYVMSCRVSVTRSIFVG